MSAALGYGSDVSTFPDLDDSFGALTGPQAVLQAIARSLLDQDEGVDLRLALNDSQTSASLLALQQTIETQCLTDERIASASASVTMSDLATMVVSIDVVLADSSQAFKLTLTVDALDASLLIAQG